MSSQKNIFITGATKGIGLEITRVFLSQGCKVYGVGRSPEIPKELEDDKNFIYRAFSVTSSESVEQFFIDTPAKFDLIVNCAGILKLKNLENTSIEDWKETLDVNTLGSFFIAKYGTRHFLEKNKRGIIVFIGSRWGISGSSKDPAYAASKSALRAMVKSFQQEGVATGIRYILLSPGSVLTDMSLSVDERVKENILQTKDIADLVMYLFNTPERVIFDEISIKAFPYDFTNA